MTSMRSALTPCDQLTMFRLDSVSSTNGYHGTPQPKYQIYTSPLDRRDVFNAHLTHGLTWSGPYDIPAIGSCTLVPNALVAFSEINALATVEPGTWVHFYEDDYKFVRLWRSPERYIEKLKRFSGVISPDFSLYWNMPRAQQIEHTFRNQLLGARMQTDGLNVIPNVRLCGRQSIPYALAGTPKNSTIALGLHGCIKSAENRRRVFEEIKILCDAATPENLIVYGSPAYGVLEYPQELGIPVYVFPPDTFTRSRCRKAPA